MTLNDFAHALASTRVQVLWARTDAQTALQATAGRTPVAIGSGFPRESELEGPRLERERGHASISAWFGEQPDAALPSALRPQAGLTPEQAAGELCFFVKDASPDSVFTVLLILARRVGVDDEGALVAWHDEVSAWDAGDMPAEPEQSWSALASTHAHARFPDPPAWNVRPAADELQRFAAAWQAAFRFLLQTLADGHQPARMPAALRGEGRSARAALGRLRQIYEDCLQHARVLQLSLPLRGVARRRVVVDTLFCVEHEASDALKLFARTDRNQSPGRRGFGLVVSYRPRAEDWNRYTLHSDPRLGSDLGDIWVELERRETAAWTDAQGRIERTAGEDANAPGEAASAGARASFPPERWPQLPVRRERARPMPGVLNCWVNPWYLSADASLIGSPGKDHRGIAAGPTRLDWPAVMDAVWTTGMPMAAVRLVPLQATTNGPPAEGQPQRLLDIPAFNADRDSSAAGPWLRYLRWPRDSHTPDASGGTAELGDTALALLAALSAQPGPVGSLTPDRLPPAGSYRRIALTGGFAVIAEQGCVVIDDWRDAELNAAALFDAMQRATAMHAAAARHGRSYLALCSDLEARSAQRTDPLDRPLDALLKQLARLRSELAITSVDSAALHLQDANAALLYRELVDHWRARERLALADQGYARLEQSARGLIDSRSGLAIKIIGLWGVPLAVAGVLSKAVGAGLNALLLQLGYRLQVSDTVSSNLRDLADVALFIVITPLLMVALRRYMGRQADAPVQLQHHDREQR